MRDQAGRRRVSPSTFRQRVVQGNVRRPGGRTLSQEDLEAYGLSIEVSSDFGLPTSHKASPQPQPFSPTVQFVSPAAETVTSITSISPLQPNKQVTPTSQFCPAPGKPQPTSQMVAGALQASQSPQFSQQSAALQASQSPQYSQQSAVLQASQSPQYSQQNFRPAANNLPFRSQFSPPNTINSKQPFQF